MGLLPAWLLLVSSGCDVDRALLLPARESEPAETQGLSLVARIAHVSDSHAIDEESPARFAGAQVFTRSAWRPYEAYSTQLFDGIVRQVNRIHASGRRIDFLVHTGDACDNAQANELSWFLSVLDGERIDPLTGPDDRSPEDIPDALLDPHAPFVAQGLYRSGVHGDAPSIAWYTVFGNHDVHAIGVFAFFRSAIGFRAAPLPLDDRPGILLPTLLNPVGFLAHGNVTPADPGPPELFETPRFVRPNAARRFFTKTEFIDAMFDTETGPVGHGFAIRPTGASWYSVSPVAGLRLIGLDTTDAAHKFPGLPYSEGAVSVRQLLFLKRELAAAAERGELVVVASHHPSASLLELNGTAVVGSGLRALLNRYPNVILHLAGHTHRNRVSDRGGYLEIETCSTLDLPQEGRIVEIWQDSSNGSVVIAYEMFSHLDATLPAIGDDPLLGLRRNAHDIAVRDRATLERAKVDSPRADAFADRYGVRRLNGHRVDAVKP